MMYRTFRESIGMGAFADTWPPFMTGQERHDFHKNGTTPEVKRCWQLGKLYRKRGHLTPPEIRELDVLLGEQGCFERWVKASEQKGKLEEQTASLFGGAPEASP
jgi:hypothetical protein